MKKCAADQDFYVIKFCLEGKNYENKCAAGQTFDNQMKCTAGRIF